MTDTQTKATHTPGPWKLILHGNEVYPFPLSINTADDKRWITRDGTVAYLEDARLIAAAPEMIADLIEIARCAEWTHGDCQDRLLRIRQRARFRIAKATGGEG